MSPAIQPESQALGDESRMNKLHGPGNEKSYGDAAEQLMYWGTATYDNVSGAESLSTGMFDQLTLGEIDIDSFDREIRGMLKKLGLTESATRDEVNLKIKMVSLQSHPDKLPAQFGGCDGLPESVINKANEKQQMLNLLKEKLKGLPLPSEPKYVYRLGEAVDRAASLRSSLSDPARQMGEQTASIGRSPVGRPDDA
jgi:hypothetical protein